MRSSFNTPLMRPWFNRLPRNYVGTLYGTRYDGLTSAWPYGANPSAAP